MPELPEVETIRRQLAPHLEGRTLCDVEILDWRWTRPQDPAMVADGLRGQEVRTIGRAGKYLVWTLSQERFLAVHLRMTGALLFDPKGDLFWVSAGSGMTSGNGIYECSVACLAGTGASIQI